LVFSLSLKEEEEQNVDDDDDDDVRVVRTVG
jgi:hypothetical protein